VTLVPTRPRSSVLPEVFLDGVRADFTVIEAIVTLNENEHPNATISVTTRNRPLDFNSMPGQRIQFQWGDFGNTDIFQGYVAAVNPRQQLQATTRNTLEDITCIGPTMVLKGNKPRFWDQSTCTQAIASICSDNMLGFCDQFQSDQLTWRTLAQTCETDWEMVNALANRIGAHIVTTKGVVRLINYWQVASRETPVRTFQMKSNIDPGQQEEVTGSIVELTSSNLSQVDPLYQTPQMSYLAQRAVTMTPPVSNRVRGATYVSRFATSMPALSAQEAAMLQAGYYLPDWPATASVRVLGDATLEPGLVVEISTVKNPAMVRDYDGFWYVKGVEHTMSPQRFFSTMSLGRTPQRAYNYYQHRPFWQGDARGVPLLRVAGSGQWYSTWRAVT